MSRYFGPSFLPGLLLCTGLLVFVPATPALMAGAAPDSPGARVDANLPASPWGGVVAVRVGNGLFSGVAVSRHHILTAGHVAAGAGGNPAMIRIVVNAAGDESATPGVMQIDLFPTFSFPYDDLALLTLEEPLPEDVPTYPVNDLPAQPEQTALTLVGYGASGNGDKGVSVNGSATVKRVGKNMLDVLLPSIDRSGRTSRFYFYDFDSAEGNGVMGGPSLGNTQETTVAVGDSGSPAFTLIDGTPAVTGINTMGTPLDSGRPLTHTFGQGGGGILLSDPRFVKWLLEKSHHEVRLISNFPPAGWLQQHSPLLAGCAMAAAGLTGIIWWYRRRR